MSEKNVVALPGYQVPNRDPVPTVVEILKEALALAENGEVIGVAVVSVYRQPLAFGIRFHGEQMSRHALGAGTLALGYEIGKELTGDEE